MKNQYIEKAAHGSSGASELNTRGAGVLMSAKTKISTFARRHKAKILLFLLSLPVAFSAFGGTARVRTFTTGTNYTYSTRSFDSTDDLYPIYYNTPFGILLNRNQTGISSPVASPASDTWAKLLNNQIALSGTQYTNSPADFAAVNKIYVTAFSLLSNGYSGSGVLHHEVVSNHHCYNVDFRLMVQDVLSSTNTAFHSLLLSSLASINSSISNIRVDLGQFQTDYQNVNSGVLNISNYLDAAAANNVISEYQAELYKSNIASAYSDPSTFGDPTLFARSIYDEVNTMVNTLSTARALDRNPSALDEFAKQFGESFSAGGSHHYTTPLTNEMQRMSTNWVQETKASLSNWVEETKAALSNNTQKIKDDLQGWREQLSGPHGSQAAIVSKLDGAINAQGAVKVEVQNSNNELHVNVNGPVELKATQFNDINNKLQANFDQFHHWVYDIPESWVRYYYLFRDNSSAVLTNQFVQASLLSSLTNLVSDFSDDFSGFSLAFASNTTFAVSNALLGLSLSPTNELWNYYFDRFKKANEFNDDSGLPFSLDLFRQQVFGTGFDESKFRQLDWFSRVELLLYQIAYAETNDVPEAADIETELEDVTDMVSAHAEDFVATSVKVVSVFNLLKRFADSVKLAFTPQNGELSPMTSGIVLLQGGSWLVNEPLVLNVPVPIQNALRLVFQCIWYLGAFVLGWRVFSAAWDRVVAVVRWIWSAFDI